MSYYSSLIYELNRLFSELTKITKEVFFSISQLHSIYLVTEVG